MKNTNQVQKIHRLSGIRNIQEKDQEVEKLLIDRTEKPTTNLNHVFESTAIVVDPATRNLNGDIHLPQTKIIGQEKIQANTETKVHRRHIRDTRNQTIRNIKRNRRKAKKNVIDLNTFYLFVKF